MPRKMNFAQHAQQALSSLHLDLVLKWHFKGLFIVSYLQKKPWVGRHMLYGLGWFSELKKCASAHMEVSCFLRNLKGAYDLIKRDTGNSL